MSGSGEIPQLFDWQRVVRNRAAIGFFFASRLWAFVLAFVSFRAVARGGFGDLMGRPAGAFWALRWDARIYASIASDGYRAVPGENPSVAFFPLYPMTLRVLADVGIPIALAGYLVSNVASLAAFIVFAKLCRREGMSREATSRALALLAFFPTSYYFSLGYAEGLFFLLLVGALYAMRTQRWWWAAALSYFATLTRGQGLLLAIPFALEWVAARRERGRPLAALPALGVAAAPAGLATFMLYLHVAHDDALAFATAQEAWGRHFTWIWETFAGGTDDAFHRYTQWGMALVPVAGLGVMVRTRARSSYLALTLAFWLLSVHAGHLHSIARNDLVIAPMFLGFGTYAARNTGVYSVALAACAGIGAIFLLLYVNGYQII